LNIFHHIINFPNKWLFFWKLMLILIHKLLYLIHKIGFFMLELFFLIINLMNLVLKILNFIRFFLDNISHAIIFSKQNRFLLLIIFFLEYIMFWNTSWKFIYIFFELFPHFLFNIINFIWRLNLRYWYQMQNFIEYIKNILTTKNIYTSILTI